MTRREMDADVAMQPQIDNPVDWRRLRRPLTYLCFSMSSWSAQSRPPSARWSPAGWPTSPRSRWSALLALCVIGGAASTPSPRRSGRTVVDRAEGRLRADLLDAAMAQPLAELSEQAVGEVLDRIDDDTWEVGPAAALGRVDGRAHLPRLRSALGRGRR